VGTGAKSSAADAYLDVDMSAATFSHTTYTLDNVRLSSKTGGTVTVTGFRVEFPGGGKIRRIQAKWLQYLGRYEQF
jgi:hypothetical protein